MSGRGRLPLLLMLLAFIGLATWAPGQPAMTDPVTRLRQALRAPYSNLSERDRVLHARIAMLRGVVEMRQAFCLTEWRDRNADATLANVDRTHRSFVGEQFIQGMRAALQRGDLGQVAAAVDQIAEMASALQANGESLDLPRFFTNDLLRCLREGQPPVQAAAAKALGMVEPPLELALPALASALKAKEPPTRLATVEGLTALLRPGLRLMSSNEGPARMRAVRSEAIGTFTAIVPLLGVGLADWHPEIRRRCASMVGETTRALGRLVSEPQIDEEGTTTSSLADLRALAYAFRDLSPGLARALRDTDAEVRLAAQKVLEEMAVARLAWVRTGASDDPLLQGLRGAVPALAEAVGDPEIRIRRAAIDVLEMLGPTAASAAPALTRALGDGDRFVRWSAIRALNNLGPGAAKSAIPSLARLLEDADIDVRKAAAAALDKVDPQEQLLQTRLVVATTPGPSGSSDIRTALPALMRSLKASDTEMRLGALRGLRTMGNDAAQALTPLREALRDPSPKVRVAAAEILGQLGPLARDASEDLRVALADNHPDVRRAAGEALINLVRVK